MQTQMHSNNLASPLQTNQAAYTEMSDLAKLRRQSKHEPNDAMQKVARQFESLFLKMMLKSMRQASFGNPLFDSSQTELYQEMFDDQIALNMANGKGIGLADSLMKQLSHFTGKTQGDSNTSAERNTPQEQDVSLVTNNTKNDSEIKPAAFFASLPTMELNRAIPGDFTGQPVKGKPVPVPHGNRMPAGFDNPESFVRQMWPMAQNAANELGVSPQVLIAQAALETGWGKAVSQHQDGQSSHNLFNIKADQRWSGNTISKSTLEFDEGVAKRQVAKFRAYDNYADSFNDYVQFLKSNPRYRDVLNSAGEADKFVTGLQQAGYATDPQYAEKILDILNRESMQTPLMENLEQLNG